MADPTPTEDRLLTDLSQLGLSLRAAEIAGDLATAQYLERAKGLVAEYLDRENAAC